MVWSPTPPPDELSTRRYLTVAKFASLIQTSSLFFSRIDQFPDDLEGTLPGGQDALRQSLMGDFPKAIATSERTWRAARRWTFVNSWTGSQAESISFWERYCSSRQGVAVESTVGRLRAAIGSAAHPEMLFFGAVGYANFERAAIDESHIAAPAFVKRHEYSDEREVRAVFVQTYDSAGNPYLPLLDNWDQFAEQQPAGRNLPVDLGVLVKSVTFYPRSQPWTRDVIRQIVSDAGIQPEFRVSSLERDARF